MAQEKMRQEIILIKPVGANADCDAAFSAVRRTRQHVLRMGGFWAGGFGPRGQFGPEHRDFLGRFDADANLGSVDL
jgi:hypothetical protein